MYRYGHLEELPWQVRFDGVESYTLSKPCLHMTIRKQVSTTLALTLEKLQRTFLGTPNCRLKSETTKNGGQNQMNKSQF